MQNLIAVLLLFVAAMYLLLKWMPTKVKGQFREILAKRHPALTPLLIKISDKTAGCGSGCDSCSSSPSSGSCSSPETKPVKMIRNIPASR